MKKKLLISLAGVFGFLVGGLLIISFVFAQKLKRLAEERKDEPKLQFKGELTRPLASGAKFKHKVCEYFPVVVKSEAPEDHSYGKSLCDVIYKGEKLGLVFDQKYLPNVLSVFDLFIMKDYRELSVRQKVEMIFESEGPGDVNFLLSKRDVQHSILYMMNGMKGKFKTWDKYYVGKDLMYIWDVTRGSFQENKVQIFTDNYSITCLGQSCINYLFESEIL